GTPCLSYSEEGGIGPLYIENSTASTDLPAVRRSRAVAASYVVVPFLPLLCDVRRPRAGCSRHGVTVSGAPAKITLV
ncbi:hypothetical protein L249_7464, partial [Ophiocordyceps polyrhachis-furcata BCC 54312]